MTEERLIEQLIALARKEHFMCGDPYYNCPLSEEGSPVPDYPKDECRCDANTHNAKVERIAAAIRATQMTDERAREILGEAIEHSGGLRNAESYIRWWPGSETATLDDSFTAEQLKAIAFWMGKHAT